MEKLFIKTEKNIITGYLHIKSLTPLCKTGCNFVEKDFEYVDENGETIKVKNDFENAIEIDSKFVDEIVVEKSTFIDGVFTSNKEN